MSFKLLPSLKQIRKTKGNDRSLPEDSRDHTVKLQGALAEDLGSKGRIVKIRVEDAKRLDIQSFQPFPINPDIWFCDF